ncbi:hypothetical protein C0995_007092 [Termitomyces sp. Mi166|nr:hypothetical protein C0995_007092 [Termitomyces sp. Mi166\
MRALSALARRRCPRPRPNPFSLVAPELQRLRSSLLGLLGSAHPGLSQVAEYYFLEPAHQLRSLLVLLFAHATNGLGPEWPTKHSAADLESRAGRAAELDTPLTCPDVLANWHPSMPNHTASFSRVFDLRPVGLYTPPPSPAPSPLKRIPALATPSCLLPTQLRLARIVEMVHIASVLHDDVDDETPSRTDSAFGNKLSILAADFLLGRASAALSRLGEPEVVELIASVLSNQAEGKMLHVHPEAEGKMLHVHPEAEGKMLHVHPEGAGASAQWDTYLRKTYLKTASLMAKGACASVVLGGCSGSNTIWKDAAYTYGRNLGIAYQLIEDTLPITTPAHITAPLLFAAEEHPDLSPLIQRNLTGPDDASKAHERIAQSRGVERTRALAVAYAERARDALDVLPESEHRRALEDLTVQGAVAETEGRKENGDFIHPATLSFFAWESFDSLV